jgi:hypothetical protein
MTKNNARGKQNKITSTTKTEVIKGKEGQGERQNGKGKEFGRGTGDKKVIEGVTVIKVLYVHVQKCHDETAYNSKFTNKTCKKRKIINETKMI